MALSEVSRGAAFGDIDNDGDMDIVINNNNGPARLLLNQSAAGGHWLMVDVAGRAPGTRVGVFLPGGRALWRRVHTDGSYLSASDPRVHFGLGAATSVEKIEVRWPDGFTKTFGPSPADRIVRLSR